MPRRAVFYGLLTLLAAALYVGAGKLSLMFATLHPSASPVWPPTGLSIALLLILGLRFWPAIAIGAFLVNITTTGDIASSLGIATGNTLEAVAGAYLTERWSGGLTTFERMTGVFRFALIAGVASILSASIGVGSLLAAGLMTQSAASPAWLTWWMGNVVGALLFTPLILLWRHPTRIRWDAWSLSEALMVVTFSGTLYLAIFSDLSPYARARFPLAHLALLPVLWASLRLGTREAIAVVAMLSTIAIAGTASDVGPFAATSVNVSLVFLQMFLGVLSVTGLALAAARQERRAAEARLEDLVQERTRELALAREQDRGNLERLRATIHHLPLAALLMDEGSGVLELNDAYCRMFDIGVSAAEAKTMPLDDLLKHFLRSLAKPEQHMPKVLRTIDESKPVFGEEIHLKDGRIILRDFIPMYKEQTLLGRLFLYRDVTQERRVDRAKSEFMSLASHQLRTPLTAMRWSLGRLQKRLAKRADPDEEKLTQEALSATARMAETIETMLKISRIEAKATSVRKAPADLAKIFQEKRRLLQPHCDAKRQTLRIECADPFPITTDEVFLREILRNLLHNAAQYTPEGGTIVLRARREGATAHIDVEDTGYGIPLHQQPFVFQKFFRGDNVASRETSGTGLGLYLVYLLINALGGTITFTSAEGKGTVFRCALPV